MKKQNEIIKGFVNLVFTVNRSSNTVAIIEWFKERNLLQKIVNHLDAGHFSNDLIDALLLSDARTCKALIVRIMHGSQEDVLLQKRLIEKVTRSHFEERWHETLKRAHGSWYHFLSSQILKTDHQKKAFLNLLMNHPEVVEESFSRAYS